MKLLLYEVEPHSDRLDIASVPFVQWLIDRGNKNGVLLDTVAALRIERENGHLRIEIGEIA